ncbi:MAG TPA: hypothetical protein VHT96_07860 [Clostridia bacterium]|nr:hypothetical protein [Clostridia bacterium]
MDAMTWLLEPADPSVRYRTLVELIGRDQADAEVQEARQQLYESGPVKALLNSMHPDGYWLQRNPATGEVTGQDVVYGSFGSTHFCLAYCAELGLDRSNPLIEKAASRYLGLQKDDGDWYSHLSCLYGYNIRTFILLGYRDDKRVRKAIDMMLDTARPDGGYLCDFHEKGRGKPPKSCIRGSVKALLALSELPEYWEHERCRQLTGYFLNRNGIYRSRDRGRIVNYDMERNSFPITWRTNSWEILYALAKMGYGRDERLDAAWDAMDKKRDELGRYILDWTPAQCPWKVGKKGEPNKWITLYCMLAKKYRS